MGFLSALFLEKILFIAKLERIGYSVSLIGFIPDQKSGSISPIFTINPTLRKKGSECAKFEENLPWIYHFHMKPVKKVLKSYGPTF